MPGPSTKNSTEAARQRIEWCRVPIRMSYISYESTDQWKRSLGRHVRGLREYWLKPHQDGICLAEARRTIHDQKTRTREDLTDGMFVSEVSCPSI